MSGLPFNLYAARPYEKSSTAASNAIVGQQISVKAAAKIYERFREVTKIDPHAIAGLTDEDIKTIGLSGQKSRYISDLADHFVQNSAVFNHLDSLPDDEVITELTKVKGIGVWTAQMFLIFTLHRPDVFAPDDRGLQLAVERLYEKSFTRSELDEFASQWSPYRSTACLHLWKSLNNSPK
ncbi:DNA-3-methyladenine glycosylase 2 family protein [Candidatus Saccharibacteria bacterium]|nr:DNA-3-methyladenine glycosylase 2 family protein [Candidatus Saccharibacteria bacterium]